MSNNSRNKLAFFKFDNDIIFTDNQKYLKTYDLFIYCLILTKAPFYLRKEKNHLARIYYDDLCRDLQIEHTSQNRKKIQKALQVIHDKKILNIMSDKQTSKLFFEIDFYEIFEFDENQHFTKLYAEDLFMIFDFVFDKRAFHLYINLLVRNNYSKFLMKDHSVQFLSKLLDCDKRTCQRAIRTLKNKHLLIQQHNGERSEQNREISTYLVFNQLNTYKNYAEIYQNFSKITRSKNKGISVESESISEALKQNQVINYLKQYYIAHNRNLKMNNIYLNEVLNKAKERNMKKEDLPFD